MAYLCIWVWISSSPINGATECPNFGRHSKTGEELRLTWHKIGVIRKRNVICGQISNVAIVPQLVKYSLNQPQRY